MKIGELAQAAQCTPETVRYYEKAGLLPPPSRSDGNYRVYGPAHLERLVFVRHCRALDMTHEEIRELLELRDVPDADCAQVNVLLDAHIEHVERRIRDLNTLREQLTGVDAAYLNGIIAAAERHPEAITCSWVCELVDAIIHGGNFDADENEDREMGAGDDET